MTFGEKKESVYLTTDVITMFHYDWFSDYEVYTYVERKYRSMTELNSGKLNLNVKFGFVQRKACRS